MPPREISTDKFYGADPTPPTTPLQALMEAPPGVEPAVSSIEQTHALADVLESLLAEFTEDERDIVTMHVAGFSVREIADTVGISKTTIHRKLPLLMKQVAAALKSNQEVMDYVRPRADEGAQE